MKLPTFGEVIDGRSADGTTLHAAVFDENQVRAAAGVTMFQVALQQRELFLGRPWTTFGDDEIGVRLHRPLLRTGRLELARRHAHRDARLAALATGAIGDCLAATEPDTPQRIVELFGMRAFQLGKDLTLRPPRQVRTRRRAGHEKAGEANGCRHVAGRSSLLAFKMERGSTHAVSAPYDWRDSRIEPC